MTEAKYLVLVCAAIAVGSLLSFCMTGCTSDGNFDAAAYSQAVGATTGAYEAYDRSQHPKNYPQYPPQPYYYHP